MGNGPRNRWAWNAGCWTVALAVAVALLIAPIVVILTHGPAAHAFGADTASQIATHGHAHGDVGDGPFGGHDATDHEHHLQALLVQPGEAWRPMASGARHGAIEFFRGLPRDRPKRPPRPV